MRFPSALSVLAVLSVAAPALAEKLRIATWNLENYTLTDRMTPDGWSRHAPKPEKQKDALRSVVRALDADVLAVQEIGGPEFAEELRRDLKAEGFDYPYAAVLEGPDPHRRLAVFSKRPFAGVFRETRLETTSPIPSPDERVALVNRGLLGVELPAGARKLRLYVVHLKSRLTRDKRDPRGETERRAEALAVREKLAEYGAGAPDAFAMLCGDFNDGPNAAAVTCFEKIESKPFLLRLEPRDPAGGSWTYRNDKKGFMNRSDYLFASPALRPAITRCFVSDLKAVGDASDHRPVVAELEIP